MNLMGNFMPHGHCYLWREDLLLLHVGSDILISLCYIFIPCCLIYLTRKRNDLPSKWIFYLFAAFIFLCGVTHINQIITVWHGVYRYTGVFKLFTAMISLITCFVLIRLMPRFLNLPKIDDVFKTIELELFRVFNRIPIGLISFSKHDVKFVNDYLKKVLDVKPGSKHSDKLLSFINEDFIDGAVTSIEVGNKKMHFQVYKEKRKDETLLYLLDNSTLIENTDSIIENYRKHSLAISGINDGFWQWNIKDGLVEWDRRIYELFNLDPNIVPDFKLFLDIIHPHDRLKVQAALKEHVENGVPYDIEFRVEVEGKYRWFRDRGIILEQDPSSMIGTLSDITDRKLSAIRLRKVLFASSDYFFDYNFENNVVWTEGLSDDLNFSEDFIRRAFKNPWTLKSFSNESQRIIFSWWRDLILSRDVRLHRDAVLCLIKDGKELWIKCSLLLEKNEKGEVFNASGSLTNVTELKLIQKDLEEKGNELRKSNELLEKFAFAASHDLQAPIRHIAQFVELLKIAVESGNKEDIETSMSYIREATFQMRELVRGLLEYSRIGMESVSLSRVNAKQLLKEAISFSAPLLDDSDSINMEIEYDCESLLVDSFKMKILFQNLIDNAIKNRSSERSFQLDISIKALENEIVFLFKDNGKGLDKGVEKSIFILFSKSADSIGSGIGLALCDQITKEHGGSIKAYNNDEFGCTFEIRLPKKA